MRKVIVNESGDKPYAMAFSNDNEALAKYKRLLLRAPDFRDCYDKDSDEYKQVRDAQTWEDLGAWPDNGSVLVLDEGKVGVWTGFSSSDRNAIGGSLGWAGPVEEWLGNGDPTFYLTCGTKDGHKITGTVAVSDSYADGTHPLYQAWLAAHPDEVEQD
jgi:hypothetical protein